MQPIIYVVLLLLTHLTFASEDTRIAIESIREKHGVPALAVVRIQNEKTIDSAFTGMRKFGDATPVQSTDQFHLGSCTKAMTATLIGMLVEQNKLRWNSSLQEIYPELEIHPEYKSVTIEMIAAHRGGLPPNIADPKLQRKLWDVNALAGRKLVLESVLKTMPTTVPGSQHLYSNVGYMILGSIIDRVSGKSWEAFIEESLFASLGMGSCGFGPSGDPEASPPDQPWGHRKEDSEITAIAPNLGGDNPPAFNSAGRVHCSLFDWAKFLQMHIDGFNGRNNLLLTPVTFSKLHTPYPGQDYTPGGWIVVHRKWANGPVLTHEGSNGFSLADVWLAPLKNEMLLAATNLAGQVGRAAYGEALVYLIQHNEP